MIHHTAPRRRSRVVSLLAALAVLLPAAPASAHASVSSVLPAPNSVHRTQPSSIAVSFNEAVSTSATKVQLLNGSGAVVRTTFTSGAAGSSYALSPIRRLAPGGYVLRWAVVSADGHPVSGASSFWVGTVPRPGSRLNVSLSSGSSSSTLALSSNRRGVISFQVPPSTSAVEFRHPKVGAALTATVVGSSATVVLPLPGSWNVSVITKPSEFSEVRMLGKFTLS